MLGFRFQGWGFTVSAQTPNLLLSQNHRIRIRLSGNWLAAMMILLCAGFQVPVCLEGTTFVSTRKHQSMRGPRHSLWTPCMAAQSFSHSYISSCGFWLYLVSLQESYLLSKCSAGFKPWKQLQPCKHVTQVLFWTSESSHCESQVQNMWDAQYSSASLKPWQTIHVSLPNIYVMSCLLIFAAANATVRQMALRSRT